MEPTPQQREELLRIYNEQKQSLRKNYPQDTTSAPFDVERTSTRYPAKVEVSGIKDNRKQTAPAAPLSVIDRSGKAWLVTHDSNGEPVFSEWNSREADSTVARTNRQRSQEKSNTPKDYWLGSNEYTATSPLRDNPYLKQNNEPVSAASRLAQPVPGAPKGRPDIKLNADINLGELNDYLSGKKAPRSDVLNQLVSQGYFTVGTNGDVYRNLDGKTANTPMYFVRKNEKGGSTVGQYDYGANLLGFKDTPDWDKSRGEQTANNSVGNYLGNLFSPSGDLNQAFHTERVYDPYKPNDEGFWSALGRGIESAIEGPVEGVGNYLQRTFANPNAPIRTTAPQHMTGQNTGPRTAGAIAGSIVPALVSPFNTIGGMMGLTAAQSGGANLGQVAQGNITLPQAAGMTASDVAATGVGGKIGQKIMGSGMGLGARVGTDFAAQAGVNATNLFTRNLIAGAQAPTLEDVAWGTIPQMVFSSVPLFNAAAQKAYVGGLKAVKHVADNLRATNETAAAKKEAVVQQVASELDNASARAKDAMQAAHIIGEKPSFKFKDVAENNMTGVDAVANKINSEAQALGIQPLATLSETASAIATARKANDTSNEISSTLTSGLASIKAAGDGVPTGAVDINNLTEEQALPLYSILKPDAELPLTPEGKTDIKAISSEIRSMPLTSIESALKGHADLVKTYIKAEQKAEAGKAKEEAKAQETGEKPKAKKPRITSGQTVPQESPMVAPEAIPTDVIPAEKRPTPRVETPEPAQVETTPVAEQVPATTEIPQVVPQTTEEPIQTVQVTPVEKKTRTRKTKIVEPTSSDVVPTASRSVAGSPSTPNTHILTALTLRGDDMPITQLLPNGATDKRVKEPKNITKGIKKALEYFGLPTDFGVNENGAVYADANGNIRAKLSPVAIKDLAIMKAIDLAQTPDIGQNISGQSYWEGDDSGRAQVAATEMNVDALGAGNSVQGGWNLIGNHLDELTNTTRDKAVSDALSSITKDDVIEFANRINAQNPGTTPFIINSDGIIATGREAYFAATAPGSGAKQLEAPKQLALPETTQTEAPVVKTPDKPKSIDEQIEETAAYGKDFLKALGIFPGTPAEYAKKALGKFKYDVDINGKSEMYLTDLKIAAQTIKDVGEYIPEIRNNDAYENAIDVLDRINARSRTEVSKSESADLKTNPAYRKFVSKLGEYYANQAEKIGASSEKIQREQKTVEQTPEDAPEDVPDGEILSSLGDFPTLEQIVDPTLARNYEDVKGIPQSSIPINQGKVNIPSILQIGDDPVVQTARDKWLEYRAAAAELRNSLNSFAKIQSKQGNITPARVWQRFIRTTEGAEANLRNFLARDAYDIASSKLTSGETKAVTTQHIVEEIKKMVADGAVSAVDANITLDLIAKNPQMYSKMSLRLAEGDNPRLLGEFNPNTLQVDLYAKALKNNPQYKGTLQHEAIAHFTEGLLPDDIANAIRKEWKKALLDYSDKNFNDMNKQLVNSLISAAENGDVFFAGLMVQHLNQRLPYKLTDPSEWYANNFADLTLEWAKTQTGNKLLTKLLEFYRGIVVTLEKYYNKLRGKNPKQADDISAVIKAFKFITSDLEGKVNPEDRSVPLAHREGPLYNFANNERPTQGPIIKETLLSARPINKEVFVKWLLDEFQLTKKDILDKFERTEGDLDIIPRAEYPGAEDPYKFFKERWNNKKITPENAAKIADQLDKRGIFKLINMSLAERMYLYKNDKFYDKTQNNVGSEPVIAGEAADIQRGLKEYLRNAEIKGENWHELIGDNFINDIMKTQNDFLDNPDSQKHYTAQFPNVENPFLQNILGDIGSQNRLTDDLQGGRNTERVPSTPEEHKERNFGVPGKYSVTNINLAAQDNPYIKSIVEAGKNNQREVTQRLSSTFENLKTLHDKLTSAQTKDIIDANIKLYDGLNEIYESKDLTAEAKEFAADELKHRILGKLSPETQMLYNEWRNNIDAYNDVATEQNVYSKLGIDPSDVDGYVEQQVELENAAKARLDELKLAMRGVIEKETSKPTDDKVTSAFLLRYDSKDPKYAELAKEYKRVRNIAGFRSKLANIKTRIAKEKEKGIKENRFQYWQAAKISSDLLGGIKPYTGYIQHGENRTRFYATDVKDLGKQLAGEIRDNNLTAILEDGTELTTEQAATSAENNKLGDKFTLTDGSEEWQYVPFETRDDNANAAIKGARMLVMKAIGSGVAESELASTAGEWLKRNPIIADDNKQLYAVMDQLSKGQTSADDALNAIDNIALTSLNDSPKKSTTRISKYSYEPESIMANTISSIDNAVHSAGALGQQAKTMELLRTSSAEGKNDKLTQWAYRHYDALENGANVWGGFRNSKGYKLAQTLSSFAQMATLTLNTHSAIGNLVRGETTGLANVDLGDMYSGLFGDKSKYVRSAYRRIKRQVSQDLENRSRNRHNPYGKEATRTAEKIAFYGITKTQDIADASTAQMAAPAVLGNLSKRQLDDIIYGDREAMNDALNKISSIVDVAQGSYQYHELSPLQQAVHNLPGGAMFTRWAAPRVNEYGMAWRLLRNAVAAKGIRAKSAGKLLKYAMVTTTVLGYRALPLIGSLYAAMSAASGSKREEELLDKAGRDFERLAGELGVGKEAHEARLIAANGIMANSFSDIDITNDDEVWTLLNVFPAEYYYRVGKKANEELNRPDIEGGDKFYNIMASAFPLWKQVYKAYGAEVNPGTKPTMAERVKGGLGLPSNEQEMQNQRVGKIDLTTKEGTKATARKLMEDLFGSTTTLIDGVEVNPSTSTPENAQLKADLLERITANPKIVQDIYDNAQRIMEDFDLTTVQSDIVDWVQKTKVSDVPEIHEGNPDDTLEQALNKTLTGEERPHTNAFKNYIKKEFDVSDDEKFNETSLWGFTWKAALSNAFTDADTGVTSEFMPKLTDEQGNKIDAATLDTKEKLLAYMKDKVARKINSGYFQKK